MILGFMSEPLATRTWWSYKFTPSIAS